MVRWFIMMSLMLAAVPAVAAHPSVTLFLDGAIVEEEVPGPLGTVEVKLPAAMRPGSLRVRPFPGGKVEQVEILPPAGKKTGDKEETRLAERRDQLLDRLKALETREEIFRSAAKSQSGKAPRKTKTNPKPLATIRQGTDYALSQLEEVYRLKRKAEKELLEVDRRLAILRQETGAGGSTARIVVSGRRKGVIVSYLRDDVSWTPRYDFRLTDGATADVILKPKVPTNLSGKVAVASGRLAEATSAASSPVGAGPRTFRLPVQQVKYTGGPGSSLSFSITNTETLPLPAGEASCYWQGEYLGTAAFPGSGPGETREIAAGTGSRTGKPASP